jgi:hypothetical protein
MGVFKKKPDPIADREKALNEQIAALESQIQRLDSELQVRQAHPRLRSTMLPGGRRVSLAAAGHAPGGLPEIEPPVFQPATPEPAVEPPPRYNDLGVRRYDLPSALGRLRRFVTGPGASNPKLVSYLAAGSIKGLRPLRYERRVERNRLVLLCFFLLLLLWAITAMIV